jgi:hypothetical protein
VSENTDRVAVKTYVPAYQKERWVDHAERLGMSQSEFVRTMVQAGRSDIEPTAVEGNDGEDGGSAALEERIVAHLRETDHADFEDLLAAMTDDVERRLDEALERLQAADRIRYSGRADGYTLREDTRGRR